MKRIILSLMFWLGALNGLTALARTPLLGWFAGGRRDALAGGGAALAALAGLRGAGPPAWWLLPLALPAQIGAASLRGLGRHPRDRLRPCAENRCEAVSLALDDGAAPGLLLRPAGRALGGVVLCHGAGAHKSYYTWRLIDALLAADLAVLSIDLDGHGESRRVLDVPGVERAVGAAVARLRAHAPRVGVAGISLGGCVAARAVADGLAVDALAVIASPLRLDLAAAPYVRAELLGLLRPAFWRGGDGATPWQLWRDWGTAPTRARLSTADTIAKLDLAGALPRIACPTLLLYATGDVIGPFAPVQPLLASAPAAVMSLHAGPSHLSLTLEQAPLADLAAWLRARLSADDPLSAA